MAKTDTVILVLGWQGEQVPENGRGADEKLICSNGVRVYRTGRSPRQGRVTASAF